MKDEINKIKRMLYLAGEMQREKEMLTNLYIEVMKYKQIKGDNYYIFKKKGNFIQ